MVVGKSLPDAHDEQVLIAFRQGPEQGQGAFRPALLINPLDHGIRRIRFRSRSGEATQGGRSPAQTSGVPADQVRGDGVEPGQDAVAEEPDVPPPPPRVQEGPGHEVLRCLDVAGPTEAEVEDRVGVPVEEISEGARVARRGTVP